MFKIKYILVLINQEPMGGEEFLFDHWLGRLSYQGRPLKDYAGKKTKKAVKVVGPQPSFSSEYAGIVALQTFPEIWKKKAKLEKIVINEFEGMVGRGVFISHW